MRNAGTAPRAKIPRAFGGIEDHPVVSVPTGSEATTHAPGIDL